MDDDMGDVNLKCARCGSAMQRGHMPDFTHGGVVQERWAPGDPEEIRFLGMDGGIKRNKEELLKVIAYRCVKCGLLEMYALSS
jgi:hypothetical protein